MKLDQLVSTRDTQGISDASLRDAIANSKPSDGGLFVPKSFPQFSLQELSEMAKGGFFQSIMKKLFSSFDLGLSQIQVDAMIDDAYNQWDNPNQVIPVKEVNNSMYLLGLSEGPTYAFKDVALQMVARLIAAYKDPKKTINVVGASSGDTISAAHRAVRGIAGIQSHFGLPQVGPTEVQRLQSTNSGSDNAYTVLFEKVGFDPIQDAVKLLFDNPQYGEAKEKYGFTAFNSINIARVLAQVTYSFSGYFDLVKMGRIKMGDLVDYSVPSGNFGDALSVYYAKKMGLPVGKINVATNKNDILHIFMNTRVYKPTKKAFVTKAPSQDITGASNFERVVFDLIGPERTVQCMKSLKATGEFRVSSAELARFQEHFTSTTTSDEIIDMRIRQLWEKSSVLIDPHTATGVDGAMQLGMGLSKTCPVLCLETALPLKFPQPEGVPEDPKRAEVIARLSQNPRQVEFSRAETVEAIAKILLRSVERANS